MDRFCEIKNRNDLADFLRIPRRKLTYILYVKGVNSYYFTFEIPKKAGDFRTICAPSGDLKTVQTRLAKALLEYQMTIRSSNNINPHISHGFEKGKSIITNAQKHRNKRFILNIDLTDFFSSIHFGRVLGFFKKNKHFSLPHDAAVAISQIACHNGCLPQGAPCSPIISNLICQVLDMRIVSLARKYKLDYTRYADDLTFSTNAVSFPDIQEDFLSELSGEISRAGFSINPSKTRLAYKDSRQEVTGLVVNKKINIRRTFFQETKAMAHHLYVHGEYTINNVPGNMRQLEGRFSFINQIDHYNNDLSQPTEKHGPFNLCGREREYKKFLFYKYFFANEFPLIVTEGKTDIRYIQAALMNLHSNYPSLVQKDSQGNYLFSIRFFRRTKKWKYFFGISADGADAMKILYKHFTDQKGSINYYAYFQKISRVPKNTPVILLFDNETVTKRPLRSFINEDSSISDTQKEALRNNLYLSLVPESKLFLLTNPLVDNKAECEIEDLFHSDLLQLQLNGKTFSRKDKFDNTKYYGKDIFSRYVLDNYRTIDFSGFVPLLDTLNNIMETNNQIYTNS